MKKVKQNKEWNFITTHGLVLLYISWNPQSTAREMSLSINVTERTVRRILDDLWKGGYIDWKRTGKGNVYTIDAEKMLKHDLTRDTEVGSLLKLLGEYNNG